MRYLLDTCIIEALLKEETGHDRVRARIGAAPRGSLAISALTAVEIWTGITGARAPRAKRIAFEAWLKVLRVAAFDADSARQAFMIQRYLRQTGQEIGRTDPMIAAQARHGRDLRHRQSAPFSSYSQSDDRKLAASGLTLVLSY